MWEPLFERGLGVRAAGGALHEALARGAPELVDARHLHRHRRASRHRLHRARGGAEPAEVGVHLAQARGDARQREVLRAADRDARQLLGADRKLRTRFAPRSVCTRPSRNPKAGAAIAPASDALRAAAHRAAAAGDEVAHVHARGQLAGTLEGQAPGQVARHPVVAERGEHPDAGLLGRGPVALEHLADEGRLSGRVDVVGARRGGRRGRRARPSARTGPTVVTSTSPLSTSARTLGGSDTSAVAVSSSPPSSAASASSLSWLRAASTGFRPRSTIASAASRPVYPVAPNRTIRAAMGTSARAALFERGPHPLDRLGNVALHALHVPAGRA